MATGVYSLMSTLSRPAGVMLQHQSSSDCPSTPPENPATQGTHIFRYTSKFKSLVECEYQRKLSSGLVVCMASLGEDPIPTEEEILAEPHWGAEPVNMNCTNGICDFCLGDIRQGEGPNHVNPKDMSARHLAKYDDNGLLLDWCDEPAWLRAKNDV